MKIVIMAIHSLKDNLRYTKNFIKSTSKIKYPFDLLIFDNGSNDGLPWLKKAARHLNNNRTIEGVKLPYLDWFQYTHFEEDVGLPNAWNWGLSWWDQICCGAPYIFLCDNDVIFTESINNIIPFLLADKKCEIGLAAPEVLWKEDIDPEKEDLEERVKPMLKEESYDGLYGFCKVLSKRAFRKIGWFDPQFAYSFDDCDYYERVKKAGLKSVVYKNAMVYHYGGASTVQIQEKLGTPKVDSIWWDRFNAKHGA